MIPCNRQLPQKLLLRQRLPIAATVGGASLFQSLPKQGAFALFHRLYPQLLIQLSPQSSAGS